MILPYAMRLACLCLELLFLINLTASSIALAGSHLAMRVAKAMPPRRAALLFLSLRLLPFALAISATALLCAPSYLRFEDNPGSERVGPVCLAMAAVGLALCIHVVVRSIATMRQLASLHRQINKEQVRPSPLEGTDLCVAGQDDHSAPILALVGILRPRLIVSPRLLEVLSPQQLDIAMRHEQAHLRERDNLKRLLIALTPGAVPFLGGFVSIERQWQHYAELAADDAAGSGQASASIALAEALLQVARLSKSTLCIPLASLLSADDCELTLRVHRLLSAATSVPSQEPSAFTQRAQLFAWTVLSVVLLCTLPRLSVVLYPWLETLLR